MKYVTFERNGSVETGIVQGDQVAGLKSAGFTSLVEVIAGGAGARATVAACLAAAKPVPLASVRLLAPIPRPPKLICVGLNYRDHALESKLEIPAVPTIFAKFPTAVVGPGDRIVLPSNSQRPDFEAEFAFVVGRRGRHIPKERWQDHVFGYLCANDVSARDFQMATTQWTMGKTFDTFAPLGPWIVTADEIPDPHALDISLRLNGERMQHSNTRELIFRIPDLIAYLSSAFTLEPGDIVLTGTPAGVGFARKPPRWLRPGDEVEVAIEGIGKLRNRVVAERQEVGGAAA